MTTGGWVGKIGGMTSKQPRPKVPTPDDLRSAAQAAADAAQALAAGAMRMPTASARLAAQMPDLIENLADATERLNETMDRLDRYLAVADPMIQTMDRMLPQMEAMIATGNEVYKSLSRLPGFSELSRFATGWASMDKRSRDDGKT